MKVKIGDKIVDANDEPVMLIFEDEEELVTVGQHITNMLPEARKYCMYPDDMTNEEVRKFMMI